MRTRTRLRPRLLSGLLVLGVALPTTAYADDSMRGDIDGNGVTVTGTTTTRIQSPGRPAAAVPPADAGGDAPYAATGGGTDTGAGGGSAPGACYIGKTGIKDKYVLCTPTPAPATPQEEGEGEGSPPTTITITATDTAALLVNGSGLHRQPPGPQALITLDVIAYTSPDTRTLTTTVANTPVTITATPTTYTFDWGDGTTTTTTDPGAPWPHHTITHRYQHTATATTITLTTTWTATYTPHNSTPRPVQGTITTTETTPPFDIVRTTTQLTDDAEEAQGH